MSTTTSATENSSILIKELRLPENPTGPEVAAWWERFAPNANQRFKFQSLMWRHQTLNPELLNINIEDLNADVGGFHPGLNMPQPIAENIDFYRAEHDRRVAENNSPQNIRNSVAQLELDIKILSARRAEYSEAKKDFEKRDEAHSQWCSALIQCVSDVD